MILPLLIIIPLAGGLLAALAGRWGDVWARRVALVACLLQAGLVLDLWMTVGSGAPAAGGRWLVRLDRPWVPAFGIGLRFGLDGVSLLLVSLTAFLGVVAVWTSWGSVKTRVGFYHLCLLGVVAGVTGVFLATDLFLFYCLWELMLVPMYLLIAVWGHENRRYAATKFFVFTQLSGLMMLVAIISLALRHAARIGTWTFAYGDFVAPPLPPPTDATWLLFSPGESRWVFLAFMAAFVVKLPALGLHTWLPDAHTEAPTAGSVLLAGLLLKTGGYGLLRFAVPLFPAAAQELGLPVMILGAAGILYGAVLAFAQTDLKRLVAYTSVSHLGFVLLGVFTFSDLGVRGAVIQMLCHGLSTGGLFILVGLLQDRLGTRDISSLGGLWRAGPRMGAAGMALCLASLGLPGLGNFVGEFLVLVAAFRANWIIAAVASVGFVLATAYALWFMQVTFFGPRRGEHRLRDLGPGEVALFACLVVPLLWMGLLPQRVLEAARPTFTRGFGGPETAEPWPRYDPRTAPQTRAGGAPGGGEAR